MKNQLENQINKLLTKLWQKNRPIYDLSTDELALYTYYRLNRLLRRYQTMSFNQIKYNLAEVGRGDRRIDPLSLEILLNSKAFQQTYLIGKIESGNTSYYYNQNAGPSNKSLIQEIHPLNFNLLKDTLSKLLIDTAIQSGFSIPNIQYNLQERSIEILLCDNTTKRTCLLRYYDTDDWMYIYDVRVWSLWETAAQAKAMPLLLCSHIHKSCFPVFKEIGLYARALYYRFTLTKSSEAEPISSQEENNESFQDNYVKTGRFSDIDFQRENGGLSELKELFLLSKNNYQAASEKLLKTRSKLQSSIASWRNEEIMDVKIKCDTMEAIFKTLKPKNARLLTRMLNHYKRLCDNTINQ